MHQTLAMDTTRGMHGMAIDMRARDTSHGDAPRLPAQALEQQRKALMRAARALLRDDHEAADVVQETLLAALEAPEQFAGRSSLKTWLHAILKHKVADVFRQRARLVPIDSGDAEDDGLDEWFNTDGTWRDTPTPWPDPLATLSNKRFEQVLQQCIAQLPPGAARVFTLRELAGLETPEICATLGITENHCFVLMHRARMKLRGLLQQQGFEPAAGRA